ncbi:MAG TPA: hypothetical protein VJR92_05650 [Gemmatimonadaceae bacterium]|nr:hypothetical protein [Gemmatimonadaceae bacterium]
MRRLHFIASVATFVVALPLRAQDSIPHRVVAPVEARSTETIGIVRGVRHLPDGRVLVNDAIKRRLIVFDAKLANFTTIIDSTPGAVNSYGRGSAPMFPYAGDSTIFVDISSQSLLVLDGTGKVVRVTAPPRPSDVIALSATATAFDGKGRLVYRVTPRPTPATMMAASRGGTVNPFIVDSATIVRADFDTRSVDTIARVKVATGNRSESRAGASPEERYMKQIINPLTWLDDWVVTSDGAVALIRGRDYHIDWIKPDGSTSSSPKMPYDWRRLTDDDKQKIVDSLRIYYDSITKLPEMLPTGTMMGPDGVQRRMVYHLEVAFVPLNEIPDYYPPIRTGSVFADRDGNVWILPYTSAKSQNKGLVYDVVNKDGVLIERVELPEGRSIAGFGRGGVIYMMHPAPLAKPTDRPGSAGFFLERTRVVGSKAIAQTP